MKVADILSSKGSHVETTRPELTVAWAVERLAIRRVGALVVTTDGKHLMGVIGERDIVEGLKQYGAGLLERRVSDVMVKESPTCRPEDPITLAMERMTRTRQRHLPVLADGELVGIVSIGDLVKSRLQELEIESNVLRDVYLTRR